MAADLNAGRCDIMVSGLSVTPDRMLTMRFSEPYMEGTLSFVVRDHVRARFSSREAIQALLSPRIGMLDVEYYEDTLRAYLPRAEIVELESPAEFFHERSRDLDALFPDRRARLGVDVDLPRVQRRHPAARRACRAGLDRHGARREEPRAFHQWVAATQA